MRWIVARKVRVEAARGLEWARRFLAGFDTSRVEWVRVDQGRGRYGGVYGRCWYPTRKTHDSLDPGVRRDDTGGRRVVRWRGSPAPPRRAGAHGRHRSGRRSRGKDDTASQTIR